MTDDLVKRLRNEDPECGLRHSIAMEAADRIEALEAALREIACDGKDCDCQAPQYCSYGIARAALGEKKDG
jgi:hypothetical protein